MNFKRNYYYERVDEIMNTQIINIQFSVFGDFKDIDPSNSDMVLEFMKMLKDDNFVPANFAEIPLNLTNIKIYNRFSFANKDGVTINIGFDRLDVIFGYNDEGKYNEMNYDTIKRDGLDYISKIITHYNKMINRIALNITKIYNEEDSNRIENKFNDNIMIDYYKDNKPMEWHKKLIYKKSNDFKEDINIGLELNKAKGTLSKENVSIEFDGVIAIYDINTVINTDENYNKDELEEFFTLANQYFIEVDGEV